MVDPLDGCAEFDERLLEQAFSPSPDAELDRHLARCARCRAARERYLATGDALAAALAIVPETRAAAPARSRRVLKLSLAAALAAAVVAVFLLRSRPEPGVSVRTLEGAVSFAEEPGRARLEDGKASFTVDRSPFVVDTPLGVARCEDGAFTLSVAREGRNDSMDKKRGALAVTVVVTAGAVWWAAGGHEVELSTGSTWVEREASANATPDLAALEPPGSAFSPEHRAPVLVDTAPELSTSPPAAAAAAADPEPSFEILGRVVDAETGEALSGAHVVLGARRDLSRTFEAIGNSGGDGRFRASSIAVPGALPIRPGVYTDPFFVGTFFSARAEGYSPRFEVPWARFHAGSALDAREPIDLGEIRLHRGAAIAGKVVDEHGAPVADAALLLSEDLPGSARFSPATSEAVGRSAAGGSFSLERRVAPADPHSKIHLFAVSPLGIGWAALDVLEAKREVGGIEIRIGAPARLEVLVQDGHGRPIESAEVRLEPRFGPLITPRYGRLHDHAMFFGPRPDLRAILIAPTDARGRARFDRLPAVDSEGIYDVVVDAEGFARDWKDDVLVLASHDTNVVIGLEAYRPRSISGAVRSEEGAAVAGAKVETHSRGAMVTATSDAAGAYRLEGLDPSIETGWFVVSAPGFIEQNRGLPFPARGDLEGFDFVLERPEPIAGRVVDEAGRPVAGARPHLYRGNEWRPMDGEQGQTGADGAFRFDKASAGAWTLQVRPPEPATEWRSAYTMLEVKGGEQSLEVVLERATNEGARVVAEIVDAASGEPLDPAAAELWPVGPWPEGSRRSLPPVVRGAGRAVAEPVDPGSWRLWVRVAGRATAFADIQVEPDQREVRARVEVGALATLTGKILFDERVPFRPVVVAAQVGASGVPSGPDWSGASASVSSAELPVGTDGTFHLERATPGTWTVSIRSGGVLGHGSIEVPSGGVGRGELRPILGASLAFRANDAAPAGGMRVEVRVGEGPSGNDTYVRHVTVEAGAIFEHEATVWPGDVHWNLTFHAADEPLWKPSEGIALPRSGSMRVAPGEVASMPVPIVLR